MGLALVSVFAMTLIVALLAGAVCVASGGSRGEDSRGILPMVWKLWACFAGMILLFVVIGEVVLNAMVDG